jgi:hypothetical protein
MVKKLKYVIEDVVCAISEHALETLQMNWFDANRVENATSTATVHGRQVASLGQCKMRSSRSFAARRRHTPVRRCTLETRPVLADPMQTPL